MAAMLTLAFPATAEHEPHLPFYFGFAIGFPSADAECDYYGYNCDGGDTGFKVYGGKSLHENIALEISFQDLGRLRDKGRDLTTTAETEGINFSLLGIIPLTDSVFFYGKAGYMVSDIRYRRIENGVSETIDKSEEDFTYGLGLAVRFNQKYDFRVEFERLNDLGDEFVAGGDYITSFSLGGSIYID